LGAFEREADRRFAEKQKERLTRMYAALSATNEAIMRAKTLGELCELVCEAAVLERTFSSTRMAFVEPDGKFLRVVTAAGEAARRHERRFAVLFIDLDRFKIINDSLGHEAGDMLLVEIANRLRQVLRASDVVARLGCDEFVVILEEAAESHDVERISGNLLSVLSQPLQLSGHECHTTASIGVAMYPVDGSDAQTLNQERRQGKLPRQGRRQE
jgi:diguanylate cyclase (GGDEF)-like protein